MVPDVLAKVINSKHSYFSTVPIIVGVLCRRIINDEIHMHDCAELWYALSGEAVHEVNGKAFHQTPGTFVAVPAFVPHTICTVKSEDTPIFLSINVCDDYLRGRGYDHFSYCNKRIYFDGKLLPIYQQLSEDKLEIANDIAHRISDEFSKHKKMSFNRLSDLYISFIRLLKGEDSDFRLKPSVLEKTNNILAATSYISEHYREKITIEDLCKLTSMSRSGLCEYFTKITGVSPMYYLRCARMAAAQTEFLLRGKNLTEIAKLLGICNKAHLVYTFKQHFGMSFSEFKNKRQLHDLKSDQENRQRLSDLKELNDFFANNNET